MILFALLLLPQAAAPADRCGSQIPWVATVEEAAAKAKADGRLILWYVHTVENTAMDRKDIVDDYMKMGPWSMPDVVEIVKRRFVPLRMAGKGPVAERCGVRRIEFIEPGVVFLSADLKPVHRLDRVSVFQEDWWMDLLRGVLAANGGIAATGTVDELMKSGDYEGALQRDPTPAQRVGLLRRLRRYDEAEKELEKARAGDLEVEAAVIRFRRGDPAGALQRLDAVKGDEAAWLRGAALHLLNRDDEGRKAWQGIAADSPWGWKADAELRRRGPFSRRFEDLHSTEPDATLPSTSTRVRTAADVDWIVRRSVDFLLSAQRANGSWDDSTYVFGGEDSIPNVNMAVSGLCASALLACKDVDPTRVKAALDRAWPYLSDEKNMALADDDEIIWGYGYRLDYFVALGGADALRKAGEIVGKIVSLQKKDGIWRHEYEAPFTTATVLVSLVKARTAGVEVPAETFTRGAKALAKCRSPKGTFSYGYPPQPSPVEGSAGRMPLCEYALLECGASSADNVRAAVDAGFERHALLERIRKYDDHADRWRNGGFFFWYDVQARGEAIGALGVEAAKYRERMRDLVLSIPEFDGTFVDSHELGRSYGTAMGLLTLRNSLNK